VLGDKPYIVLDGAHNLGAIKRLRDALRFYFADKRIILAMGIMADKDWPRMIRAIVPMARLVLTFRIESQRACPGETLAKEARKFNRNVTGCGSIREAIPMALENAQDGDVICITGSLYAVGEAKKFFNYESIG
jgi:dihydrofolate synthase/folylpolyglutamate synthase